MPDPVGTVAALWRYPVKSMMGEPLDAADVTEGGLLGDRRHALVDRETGKVASAKSPRRWPTLFAHRATYVAPPTGAGALPAVQITLPDGRVYPCEILDISLSGAAVKVDVMPSLGTHLMLGKMRGRIVRYVESGIAIEFLKPLNTTQLSTQIR